MTTDIRVTRKAVRLLHVLLGVHALRTVNSKQVPPPEPYHMPSAMMMRQARLSSASFYPLIERLRGAGWVRWEKEVVPDGVIRPPRTFYHLTDDGVVWARMATRGRERKPWWKRLAKWIEDATDGMDDDA